MLALLFLLGIGASAFVIDTLTDEDDPATEGTTALDETGEAQQPQMIEGTNGNDIFIDAAARPTLEVIAQKEPNSLELRGILEIAEFIEDPANYETKGGDDSVLAGAADNIINTGAGDDLAFGGPGDDIINLGEGDDVSANYDEPGQPALLQPQQLSGGNDQIFGGKGNDEITDQIGSNYVEGNEGNDKLDVTDLETNAQVTPDTVQGGWGEDWIYADQADMISGGNGADRFFIGSECLASLGENFQPAMITDFETGRDVLIVNGVQPLPEGQEGDPISFSRTPDGTQILYNGFAVAEISGDAVIDRGDIFIIASTS